MSTADEAYCVVCFEVIEAKKYYIVKYKIHKVHHSR